MVVQGLQTIGSETVAAPRAARRTGRLGAFVALTKPRIIELLLVTTVPTMLLADRHHLPSLWLILATLIGGVGAAGGANAGNMYIDRDIDRVMQRTQGRPLVTGEVSPRAALVFAVGMEVGAFVELTLVVNLASALLATGAAAFYIGVYTCWLKRTSRHNIVIGGAAGAAPVLVGWAAVTGGLTWTPVLLALLVFVWTPPHFWALAVKYRDDYGSVSVPMLPSVASLRTTSRSILAYTLLTVAVSLAVVPVGHLGLVYAGAALVLGALFIGLAVVLLRRPTPAVAMQVFAFSITYLTLLFAAVAVDRLVQGV